jgi:hypothetical protein
MANTLPALYSLLSLDTEGHRAQPMKVIGYKL